MGNVAPVLPRTVDVVTTSSSFSAANVDLAFNRETSLEPFDNRSPYVGGGRRASNGR